MNHFILIGTMAFALAGCLDPSVDERKASMANDIATAFPSAADRDGIFMASPRGRNSPATVFHIGFYPEAVSDNQVLSRLQKYCDANGLGQANVAKVRGGGWKIRQDDGTLKDARRGEFRCG
ncbi:MAG: hypothetical protein ACPG5U_06860 [Planktomarina sp.]